MEFFGRAVLGLLLFMLVQRPLEAHSSIDLRTDSSSYQQFKGAILDSKSKDELVFASITVLGTTISTVSNSEGKFSIKVPLEKLNGSLLISFIGYKNKVVPIKELKAEKNVLYLESSHTLLKEVVVNSTDANKIFLGVLANRAQNYGVDPIQMIGFYRETIRKRRAYVSLSESIVNIQKQPFSVILDDQVKLFKGRKNADYTKLDTVNFKLQGGPYSALFVDLVKNPDFIFSDNAFELYDFSLEEVTQIDDNQVLVLAFKQKPSIENPLYYGKLFIDAKSLAVVSATFQLNVEDKIKSGLLFTRKKPAGLEVYPTEVRYQVNYQLQNGKWIFSYSRGDLTFKLDWDKRIFNTIYSTTVELAITDWENKPSKEQLPAQKLSTNVIMSDKVRGLADPDFWGAYNIIEPEKSIETAIKKLQKKSFKELTED